MPNRIDKLPSGSSVIAFTKRNQNGVTSTSGYYFYTKAWDDTLAYCQAQWDKKFNQMCAFTMSAIAALHRRSRIHDELGVAPHG